MKEEPERWSPAGEKLQAILAAVIRGQEDLSPFCMEVLTEILENAKGGQKETGDSHREEGVRYEVDFLAVRNVLELKVIFSLSRESAWRDWLAWLLLSRKKARD